MNMFELNDYIAEEQLKGSKQLVYHKIEKHKRIAKITLPIWLYVSITGVVIYLMLY